MSLENLPIYRREPRKSSSSASGFVHIRHFPGVAEPHQPLSPRNRTESPDGGERNQDFKPSSGLRFSPIKVRKIRANSVVTDTDREKSPATLPDPRGNGSNDPTLAIFSDMSYEKENRCIQAPPGLQKLRTKLPKARDSETASLVTGCFGSGLDESSSDNSITPRPRRTQSLHQRVVTQVRKLSKSAKAKPNTMPSSNSSVGPGSEEDLRRPSARDRPESRRSQDNLERKHQDLLRCSAISRMSPSDRGNTPSTGNSYAPSVVTSDTSLQSPTSQGFYSASHRPTASLHLSMCAYPSNDRLHADAAGTLWVAVEVSGSVKVDDDVNSSQNMTCFGPSLAVGVVIDNSFCSSTEFLDDSAKEVIRLARQMRGRGDHISLYASGWENYSSQIGNDYQIYPLQAPDINMLKWKLSSLRKFSNDASPHSDIVAALQQAVDDLRTLDFHSDVGVRTAERIVIVIAPCSDHLMGQIPELDEVQLHLISPGITSSAAPCPSGFGWFINSTCHVLPSQSSLWSLAARCSISDLLKTSRFRSQLGRTFGVTVDLVSGTDAAIEEVIGHIPEELHPGEKRSLLVKLNISRMKREWGQEEHQSTLTINRAFNEVESMLDEILHKVLAIRVMYKHTNLPANSTVEIKEDVFIRRSLALRDLIRLGSSVDEPTAKKIAVCISASFADPQQAIAKLEEVLHNAQLQVPASFLVELKDELKHQINVEGEKYLRSTFDFKHLAGYSPEKNRSKSSFELDSARLRLRAYCRLTGQTKAPDASGASPDTLSPCNSPPLEFALACGGSDRGDPAKRIWRKLRQVSRGKESDRGNEDESLPEALEAVRRLALKNKRSIGADTLQSLKSLIAEIREPDIED